MLPAPRRARKAPSRLHLSGEPPGSAIAPVPHGGILDGMPFLGASLFATVCAWLVDAVLALFAPTSVRLLVGFVVSTVAFYWGLRYLRELRGR